VVSQQSASSSSTTSTAATGASPSAAKPHPRQKILDRLRYRRSRWPGTANLHLVINQQTARRR
jgi:hypothetical protein